MVVRSNILVCRASDHLSSSGRVCEHSSKLKCIEHSIRWAYMVGTPDRLEYSNARRFKLKWSFETTCEKNPHGQKWAIKIKLNLMYIFLKNKIIRFIGFHHYCSCFYLLKKYVWAWGKNRDLHTSKISYFECTKMLNNF